MTRRVVAPVLLLLAAAVSIAAVFAVHRIEAPGGPLAEPWATPYISPDGDGVQDVAEVRFTTQQRELVSVVIEDADGQVTRTLLDDELVDGPRIIEWDGRDEAGEVVEEGAYRVRIRRAGDQRTYAPTRPIIVDVSAPVGRLDRWTWEAGQLRGLVLLEPGARPVVTGTDGQPLRGLRSFLPSPEAQSAQPEGPRPPDTVSVRFTVPLDRQRHPLDRIGAYAVDRAGNRTDLLARPDAPSPAVID
jgi:hypothetical protein